MLDDENPALTNSNRHFSFYTIQTIQLVDPSQIFKAMAAIILFIRLDLNRKYAATGFLASFVLPSQRVFLAAITFLQTKLEIAKNVFNVVNFTARFKFAVPIKVSSIAPAACFEFLSKRGQGAFNPGRPQRCVCIAF